MTVYIVSYIENDEPVVTAFDNAENANKYLDYITSIYEEAFLDEVPVYSTFTKT